MTFQTDEEEQAYIKEKGLDKFACSKHGLDMDFNCNECHDKWAEFVGKKKLYIVSDYGSTGRDLLHKGENIKDE
jgi:predicted amidophosphoribosyltransferase